MTSITPSANTAATVAPLKIVALMTGLVETLRTAKPGLPRIGVFRGFSGRGKTVATCYCVGKLRQRGIYLEIRSEWTKRKFAASLLVELGVARPTGTVADMIEQAAELLMADGGKVLFVDEADVAVGKGFVEVFRDLYEISGQPIILIGEEELPDKIKRYERVHNRVLKTVDAPRCDRDDARHLAALFCDQVKVADDMLDHLLEQARGCTRRVCTNLANIQEEALVNNWETVTRALWGERKLMTGDVAKRKE